MVALVSFSLFPCGPDDLGLPSFLPGKEVESTLYIHGATAAPVVTCTRESFLLLIVLLTRNGRQNHDRPRESRVGLEVGISSRLSHLRRVVSPSVLVCVSCQLEEMTISLLGLSLAHEHT